MVTTLEQVFREEWGRVLATLIGFLGDFDLAEEAAQEAFAHRRRPMAARRRPQQPARLADDDGSQPSDGLASAATGPSRPSSACSPRTIVLRCR